MVDIRNDQQLKGILTQILKEVIDEMSVDIRERLVHHIQAYTYFPLPNAVYEGGTGEPSFEFEQSYRWKGVKKTLNEVTNELYNAWQMMTVDRKTGRHWENGKDSRKQLADMMNVNDVVGGKQRRAYWDLFLEETDKTIDERFRKALRRKGLLVK